MEYYHVLAMVEVTELWQSDYNGADVVIGILTRLLGNFRDNSSPPGQNGRHFTDDISRWIFVNEKFCILVEISLKIVPYGPIENNPALV